MKMISKAAIAAAAFAILVPATAYADCADGQFAFYTQGTDGDGNPIAVENCRDTRDKDDSIAVTGTPEDHLKPVLDADGNQVQIDGKPIVTGFVFNDVDHHAFPFHHDKPQVVGINGIAIGSNAMVGKYTPPSCSEGVTRRRHAGCWKKVRTRHGSHWVELEDAKYTPPEFFNVNNGTALGANTSVQHDNSTAIGAGATSTDDHQVTLGTEEETIRAPGITSQLSKDRQVGPTELVTSDSEGRLATDGGATHARIDANEAKNDEQDGRLDGHDTTLVNHNSRINHNAAVNHAQDDRIDENTAAINHNTAAIEDNAASAAIALSMPDSFLNDSESYSIAAGFGGTGDDTAFGAIGTIRFDETWNGYVGGGLSFKGDQYGWKIGARAGW